MEVAMSEARDALDDAIKGLLAQAFALDRIFVRAAADALSLDRTSHRHARKALKAQARCRATFKILLTLHRARGDAAKFSNSCEGTIQRPKTPCGVNRL